MNPSEMTPEEREAHEHLTRHKACRSRREIYALLAHSEIVSDTLKLTQLEFARHMEQCDALRMARDMKSLRADNDRLRTNNGELNQKLGQIRRALAASQLGGMANTE